MPKAPGSSQNELANKKQTKGASTGWGWGALKKNKNKTETQSSIINHKFQLSTVYKL